MVQLYHASNLHISITSLDYFISALVHRLSQNILDSTLNRRESEVEANFIRSEQVV